MSKLNLVFSLFGFDSIFEIRISPNTVEAIMEGKRVYDLEERTRTFAQDVRRFVIQLRMDVSNVEDTKQLIRSSGSVGVNYIEANESLGKKDFLLRTRICRKEAKESMYWLSLIDSGASEEKRKSQVRLAKEANELMKIFGAILRKSQ